MQLSFIQRLKLAGKAFIGVFSDASIQQAYGMLAGILPGSTGKPPKRGTREILNAYNEMPWLRAVVNKVGRSVASTSWQLYVVRRGGKAVKSAKLQRADYKTRRKLFDKYKKQAELTEIEEHPLLDLIDNANSFLTGLVARQLTQIHLDLVGEAFWLKERNGAGKPTAFWPLPPDWVISTPTPTHRFFRVSFRAWQGEIPDTEILWITEPDPVNPYGRGSGTARSLADELETDEYACHDAQTECLTRRGWVRGLEITANDEVATWNEVKGQLEYQRPEAIYRYRYRGKLHHWQGRSIDALVTPNHRLWIESRIYRRPALEGPVWHFETSEQAAAKPGRVFKWRDAGRYNGKVDVITIPGVNRVTKRKPGSRGGGRPPARGINDPLEFRAVDFARFLGYYISEGSLDRAGVQLAQSEGNVQEDMRRSLSIFPSEWVHESRREPENLRCKPSVKFFVRHLGLAEWLRNHVGEGAQNKRIPSEVFEWVTEAQQELIKGLLNGDGSWRNSSLGWSNRYVTRSKGLADDLQRLCVLLGYSATVTAHNNRGKPLYHVNIRLHTGVRRIDRAANTWVHEVDYDGEVWCLTVQNGTLFTRRNGRVLLSGNSKHTKSWFYNRARPDMIISAEGLQPGDTARLEEDWLRKNQGFWKAFKPYFLNKKVDIQTISQTFENMQLVDLRKHERDTIIQVYGVPPEILGIIENSNRATIEAADFLFCRWVVQPRLEFLRTVLQERLVPEFDDRLILDYESPVIEDKEYRLNVAKSAPWSLRIDEWREMQGLDPLPDEEGKVFMLPFNLYPSSTLKSSEQPTPSNSNGQETPPQEGEEQQGEDEKQTKTTVKSINREDINRLLAAVAVKKLMEHMVPSYRDIIANFGQEMLDTIGMEINFDLLDPRVLHFLNTEATRYIKGINETTRQALRVQLIDGVEAGESIPKLADRVSLVFADAKERRATTISRTEVVRASNFGSWEGMKQGGAEEKEWLSTRDDRVRDEHLAMDGQIQPVDKPFIAPSGEQALYPGDFGVAELDINCRCAVAPILNNRSLYDTEEKRVSAWKKFDSSLRPFERRMETAAKKAFQEQQTAVMDELKRLARERE